MSQNWVPQGHMLVLKFSKLGAHPFGDIYAMISWFDPGLGRLNRQEGGRDTLNVAPRHWSKTPFGLQAS